MFFYWMYLVVFLSAFLLTAYMRNYALRKNIIDRPNERSSHSVPTPRGGGVAVVASYLTALAVCMFNDILPLQTGFSLIGAGFAVALLGFLDDHGHISSLLRLALHFLIAVGVVLSFGGFAEVVAFNGLALGVAANIIAVLFLVWLLNLYNFMDGINGLASVEAITATLSMAIIYLASAQPVNAPVLVLLAASVFGFLLWNFPRAKIFMGDACSGFLGLVLGIFALIALKADLALFCAWLICLGVFIVDATFTLVRRVLSGHKMYDAHRSHTYQIASRRFNSHTLVTLSVLAVNVLWLFPIAYLVATRNYTYPELGVLLAYLPLLLLAVLFKAGNAHA